MTWETVLAVLQVLAVGATIAFLCAIAYLAVIFAALKWYQDGGPRGAEPWYVRLALRMIGAGKD